MLIKLRENNIGTGLSEFIRDDLTKLKCLKKLIINLA